MKRWWALVLVAACRREQASSQEIAIHRETSGQVVAHVGAHVVTADDLRARIEEAGASARERYRDPREMRALLDNEIRFELLAAEAQRRGYDHDASVQEAARKAMVQKMLASDLTSASSVSDAEVEEHYKKNINDYRQPERVQLAIVKVETLQQGTALRDRLRKGKQDAMAFHALRTELGQESNRDLELKYWSKEELSAAYGEELAAAAFATQELGSFGPVTRGDSGVFVFKLTGRRAAFHRAVADVAESIRQRLFRQRRSAAFDALVQKLRENASVSVDEGALKRVLDETPVSEEVP